MPGASPGPHCLSLIAAMDPNQVIGRDNTLPWHLPEDLKRFKAITLGKPILLGRRTYESIGRPLPGRRNIVVSRQMEGAEGIDVASSLDGALVLAGPVDEAVVCGGVGLYAEALERADRLYLTHLKECFEGDAFFPDVDWSAWRVVDREVISDSVHPHTNITYERLRG